MSTWRLAKVNLQVQSTGKIYLIFKYLNIYKIFKYLNQENLVLVLNMLSGKFNVQHKSELLNTILQEKFTSTWNGSDKLTYWLLQLMFTLGAKIQSSETHRTKLGIMT